MMEYFVLYFIVMNECYCVIIICSFIIYIFKIYYEREMSTQNWLCFLVEINMYWNESLTFWSNWFLLKISRNCKITFFGCSSVWYTKNKFYFIKSQNSSPSSIINKKINFFNWKIPFNKSINSILNDA